MIGTVGLVVLALAAPVFVFYAYRCGLRDGARLQKGDESMDSGEAGGCGVARKLAGKAREKCEERELTKRERTLLANIDAYDGTKRGQKEVKG